MMVEKKAAPVKVAIREDLRRSLPFGNLKSRNSMAIVFGYFGYMEEVSDLMQKVSNKTRAYFVNAHRLRGFLVVDYVTHLLKKAEKTGELKSIA